MNDQHYRINQLVHRAYVRAKARAEIRAMGHPLPDPTDPAAVWRTRFEDTIFRLISSAETPQLSVLPGGKESTLDEGVAVGLRSGQLRHGHRPLAVVDEQPPGQSTHNFEIEETK